MAEQHAATPAGSVQNGNVPDKDNPINGRTLEAIEHTLLHMSWLGQRQFMQLLDNEPFRLTLPQYYTLLQLSQMNGECKMSDLAEATHQSAASLTGIVDRLLSKELVARTRHEHDRRQVMVVLTAQGSTMVASIRQARRTQMATVLAHLSTTEIETLLQLLDDTLHGMQRLVEAFPKPS